MPDKKWKGKGEALPRRSPRKGGKTCGRPFTAPRKKEVRHVRSPNPKLNPNPNPNPKP